MLPPGHGRVFGSRQTRCREKASGRTGASCADRVSCLPSLDDRCSTAAWSQSSALSYLSMFCGQCLAGAARGPAGLWCTNTTMVCDGGREKRSRRPSMTVGAKHATMTSSMSMITACCVYLQAALPSPTPPPVVNTTPPASPARARPPPCRRVLRHRHSRLPRVVRTCAHHLPARSCPAACADPDSEA